MNKSNSDFLLRFSGRISILNKQGEMTTSDPPTPGLSRTNTFSQAEHRSTASSMVANNYSFGKHSWTAGSRNPKNSASVAPALHKSTSSKHCSSTYDNSAPVVKEKTK